MERKRLRDRFEKQKEIEGMGDGMYSPPIEKFFRLEYV